MLKILNQGVFKNSQNIPLRLILVVPFVLQVFAAVGLTGYFSLRHGRIAVNHVASHLRSELAARIQDTLTHYLQTPHLINRINADAVRFGWLNLDEISHLEPYFFSQMQQFETVSYISLGTEQGEYIGVQRLDDGSFRLEISENKTDRTFQTWKLDPQGKRLRLLETRPNYDPRKRQWYQTGVAAGKPVWTPIYSYFSTQKLTITADQVLYDSQGKLRGVTAADLALSQISDFLRGLEIGETGQTFIMERSGLLVATSTPEKPFRIQGRQQERLKAVDSGNFLIQATAKHLQEKFGDLHQIKTSHQLEFSLNHEQHFLQVLPIRDQRGLDWLLVVAIPEADFMAEIEANRRTTILLCLAAFIISVLFGWLTAYKITRPLRRLSAATAAIANGELDQAIEPTRINEVAMLAESFNQMATQLRHSFAALAKTNEELEARVAERTLALRLSEEKFASTFRASPDPIMLSTLEEGRFIEVNDSFLDLVGMPLAEVIGKNSLELQIWLRLEDRAAMIQELKTRGMIRQKEFEICNKFGEHKTVLLSADCINIGGQTFILSVLHDITRRKRMEAALSRSEIKFRNLFENSQAGIFRTRWQDGLILDANQRFIEILGYDAAESVIGCKSAQDFYVHPAERQLLLQKLRENGKVDNYEIQFYRANGHIAWTLLSARVNEAENCIEGVLTDINDRKQLEEELSKSQQFLNSIIDNVPLAVFVKDVNDEFRNVLWNQACEKIFGLTRHQAIGHNVQDFCPPEQAAFFQSVDLEVVIQGEFIEIEEEPLDNPLRGTILLRTIKVPLKNSYGRVTHLLCISEDITERKQAKMALENALALQRAILESIRDGVMAVNHSGEIISYNQNFLDLWRLKPEDLLLPEQMQRIALLANQVVNPVAFLKRIKELYLNPEQESSDLLELKDGRVFERFSHPQKVGDKITGRVWVFRDITARVQAAEALRQSELKFRSIVENASDIIYIQDADGRFSYVSPNLKTVTGYEISEVENHSLTDFVHPDDLSLYLTAMQQVLATDEKQIGIEIRGHHKNGTWKWFIASLSPLKDETGKISIIGVSRDITERKQAEEKLKEEQQKSEKLLLNIFPKLIVQQLKEIQGALAQQFEAVTILFADIVGFTPLSARISAIELVSLLNEMFSIFDQLADDYGLEKIKTIGDAYMVAGGLPVPRSDHAEAIAEMALAMQAAITHFKTDQGEPFQIRIGINTGSVVAGVIGMKKFIYDLWGDAVNVASRMESSGIPGKIQVTAATYERLHPYYEFEKRGFIDIKGRGEMMTYWLMGRKPDLPFPHGTPNYTRNDSPNGTKPSGYNHRTN